MLVLTRKEQEKIRIGDHITITVLKLKGKAVRLGIEAPLEVPVIRGELTFDNDAIELPTEAIAKSAEVTKASAAGASHAAQDRAPWPTSKDGLNRVPAMPGRRVSLHRISRDQVGQVLPGLVADSKPLRAMLDRRSVSA